MAREPMPSRDELGQFIAVYRGSFRTIRGVFVAIGIALAIGVVIGLIKGGSFRNLQGEGPEILLFVCAVVAIVLLFARFHAVRVYTKGIEGKNFWSLPVRFYWDSIDEVRLDSSSGISAVVLTEERSGREMWIFRDVFFREEFQTCIRPYLDISVSVE